MSDLRAAMEDIVVDAWNDETPTAALAAVADAIPEGAVLATEETLAAGIHAYGGVCTSRYRVKQCEAEDHRIMAAAILRHLREGT
jgi:hypothetical protein